ncbi:MAG TPA: hypothetical protein PKJ45_08420 [Rubrivivax sp.]|nr:hypothetical protein [Rubrivivax sp.]
MKHVRGDAVRRLGSDRDAAAVLGLGERKFAQLLADPPDWLPAPIDLGPRSRRWDLDGLLNAARAHAPRGELRRAEPHQLLRARIERMKAGITTPDFTKEASE